MARSATTRGFWVQETDEARAINLPVFVSREERDRESVAHMKRMVVSGC